MTGTCLLGADVIVLMARRQAVTSILSSVVLGLSRFFLPTRILQFCRAHKPPSLPSFQFLPSAAAPHRLPFFFSDPTKLFDLSTDSFYLRDLATSF